MLYDIKPYYIITKVVVSADAVLEGGRAPGVVEHVEVPDIPRLRFQFR